MMYRRFTVLAAVSLAFSVGAVAPLAAVETAPATPDRIRLESDPFHVSAEPSKGLLGSGLFDSSRLTLNHSVAYGVTSGSFGTRNSGLWLSEIGYRISDPLRLSVDVGAVLNPEGGQFLSTDNIYLHGFNLDYRPSPGTHFSLSYRNIPANAAAASWMTRDSLFDRDSVFATDIFGRSVSPRRRP